MRRIVFLWLCYVGFIPTSGALPQRLVIALDGISYRDVRALQEGVADTNIWGTVVRRQAFTAAEGYFPVSRMVSTFPSTSDVAWTDIFGNRPLPGYQRTYYSVAANSEVSINGLTSTVEHERQMDWQCDNNFARSMGYIYSVHTFTYELRELAKNFWKSTNSIYYIYIRSSDDAQHMDRDILSMLSIMDNDLQKMRARYRTQEGRDLQILILSDHGHNHAGRGERVQVGSFLENAGYHVTSTINGPKDVVLPTSGIEDWVEVHNVPAESATLAEALTHLKGADIVTARLPDPTNCFLVLNSKRERALIRWNPGKNSFKYEAENGDPLNYQRVVEALARQGKLDADGFATADAWMNETMTNHYPLALQRIARGLTRVTLNPATILISLDNHYVNAGWLVNAGSMLETCGSTHGALDDINSLGIVLSNFTPTHDTSTDRVAGYFDDFPGLRNYRDAEDGAEWVVKNEQARTRIQRDAFDWNYKSLPANRVFLRVWSPKLASVGGDVSLEASIEKISGSSGVEAADGSLPPPVERVTYAMFDKTVFFSQRAPYERIYACPSGLKLDPESEYRISAWMRGFGQNGGRFDFSFRTDGQGRPVPY